MSRSGVSINIALLAEGGDVSIRRCYKHPPLAEGGEVSILRFYNIALLAEGSAV